MNGLLKNPSSLFEPQILNQASNQKPIQKKNSFQFQVEQLIPAAQKMEG